jgi:hypothetical protein
MIKDYLELLASELEFDRSLSRRVRQEVEDHLWEAVAADPAGNPSEMQRRAVANFGDARVIAAQFAVSSLARHSRRAGVAALLVIAGVFLAMKARIAWHAATLWAVRDDMRAVFSLVVSIDRCAFWLSLLIGLGACIYILSCEIPAAFDPAYRQQLRRFFLSCGAATAALVVSVASDAALTVLKLQGAELSAELLVPILSMAVEIVSVAALVFQIRRLALRTASTAALMQT